MCALQEEHAALDAAIEPLARRVGDERAALVADFARAFLKRANDPLASDPEALAAELAGAFELADRRGRAPAAVRAFTPTLAEHGYHTGGSVLETNTPDLPFLVDSVSAELRDREVGIRRVVHPIVGTERDRAGRLVAIVPPGGAARRESVMHFELQRQLTPEQLAALEDAVRAVLAAVRRVVEDFPALVDRVERMAELARAAAPYRPADEVSESVAFLRWLLDSHFVLLGYREYDFAGGAMRVVPDSGLGLLRDGERSTFAEPVPFERLSPILQERQRTPTTGSAGGARAELLLIDRTNRRSPVHRRVRMDDIALRRLGAGGEPRGEARLLGLFTSRAYAEPASRTPLLGHKLRRVLEAEDLIPGSHDHKAATALFDSFPTEDLLNVGVEDLRRTLVALLGVQGDDVRLLGRRHPDGRAASLIASLPRARATTKLRKELPKRVAQRFGGADVQVHEVLDENDRMRLHYTVHRPAGTLPDVPLDELQDRLSELARTWDDRAREQLVAAHGDERGRMLAARWLERFPESYKAATDPRDAVTDVRRFDALMASGDALAVGLANERAPTGMTRVKLYSADAKAELSSVVPLLEHLGLRIIEERPTRMLRRSAGETWLQDFGVLGPGDAQLDLDECGERVADVLTAALRGEAESDSLDRLVVLAGLDRGQVAVLRAYRAYRQRIGSRFTESYQNDAIAANARITAKIVRLFELKFDPGNAGSEEAMDGLRAEILSDLDGVASLDHDRILRNQLGLIDATVRTNAYVPERPVLAFKLRSADVPAIPLPAPRFEIYVHSRDVEGIHLRGGLIARGGIRWSDRMDYRTEVFGLMRAQMTKNAVIVPAGSKGGFYLRRPPADPAALRDEVRRRYVDYISGLLDVTDDLVDGRSVHPRGVRVHDGDDAYLVVAADKGTAPFSDTANAIAESRGFWLGDAFAAGGSKGYDHKALGITARGAWASLERHFLELGLDPREDCFTVVGIGDMSGDVFGNGMLLSDRIRLVAAYDHRHVFIDPDPDPDRSFVERRRLFERPGSCWDDYDRALISEGGGVWSRSAKSVPLSEQARAALGIEDASLVPTELIRAVLRAPVDVLWNGGIGTVVKASTETDDDAADRASDAIRVDARDLRVRVIAEGGNLGLTQPARIEYSRAGGRVNADFIDNSAGVDCSDHEVNLKILLGLAVERGEITASERDEHLRAVTDEVCEHVLRDSRLQAAMLEREARGGAERVLAYDDLLTELERAGAIDRARDALPRPEELAERRRQGHGLERPELAVALAHAKIALTSALMRSDLIDDPWLSEADLRAYFPAPITERFGHLLADHPLRRELVATVAANDCVDALDPTFVSRLCAERGAEPADAVRAYRIARAVSGADERWGAIGRLDRTLDRDAFWELVAGVDWMVEALTRWYLTEAPPGPLRPIVEADRPAFERVAASIAELGPAEWRESHERVARRLAAAGVPDEVARRHAFQPALVHAPDAISVARECGREVEDVVWTFQLLGEAVRIDWLEERLLALPASSRSQGWALQTVLEDLLRARRELAAAALREADADAPPSEVVDAFLESRTDARERLRRFVRSTLAGEVDLPGVMLAARHLRAVADGSR